MKQSLEELRLFIDLKMYDELVRYSEMEIQENGWNEFLQQVIEIRDRSADIDPLRPTEVNPGKINDAMLNILDLETVEGFDANLLNLVKSSQLTTLQEVRNAARKQTLKLLPRQIKKTNTYFLDISRMETNEFAIYIDDILDARTNEFRKLGEKSNLTLSHLLNTYYGFLIFASGNNASEISRALNDLAKSLNIGLNLPSIDALLVTPKGRRFTHCSSERRRLLDNLLAAALYESLHNPGHGDIVPKSVCTAIHQTASLGGVCVVPYLLEICERSSSIPFRHYVLEALSHTGDERAVDLLFQLFQVPKERDYREIEFLGRIRGPKSIAALKRFAASFLRQGRSAAIRSLGAAYAVDEIDIIIDALSSSFHPDARLAGVEALILLRDKGFDAISERTSAVIGALQQDTASLGVLEILMNIPFLRDRKGLHEILITYLDYNYVGKENLEKSVARMTLEARQSRLQRKSQPDEIQTETLLDAIRRSGLKQLHPEAIEALLSSERIDLDVLGDIFQNIKGLAREYFLSLLEFGDEELLQLLRAMAGIRGFDKDEKLLHLIKHERNRIMPVILATDDVVVGLERLSSISALRKESLAARNVLEMIPEHNIQPRFDLPQLLLFISKNGTNGSFPEDFLDAVRQKLNNTRVFEAVLATSLSTNEDLQRAMLDSLSTTFLEIASTRIRYANWTIPDWLKKGIEEYAKEASDDDPLLAAITKQGWYP